MAKKSAKKTAPKPRKAKSAFSRPKAAAKKTAKLAKKPPVKATPKPVARGNTKRPLPKTKINKKAAVAKTAKQAGSKVASVKPAAAAKGSVVVAKVVPVKKPATPAVAKMVTAAPLVAAPHVPVVAKSHPIPGPISRPVTMKASALMAARAAGIDPAKLLAAANKAKKKRRELEPSAPVRLPPAPVRSDSKMQKNRAGLSPRELEHYRDLLLEKRRELLGDVSSMEREALRSTNANLSNLPLHMADMGTDNYEQEFTLGLVEKDRQLMREINIALAKIQDGSYGICEGTGMSIAKPRLEAQPWAKHSIEHARALEKPAYRRA